MKLDSFCMFCLLKRQQESIETFLDEDRKRKYMQYVYRRLGSAGEEECAPAISIEIKKYYSSYWGIPMKDYTDIKKEYNRMMMDLLPSLREKVQSASDPLELALLYARIGNYIDFAALANVDKDTVLSMLDSENKDPLNKEEYRQFKDELSRASRLVYLTDNCGEIVLDRLVIEELLRQYPALSIQVIVRGEPVVNDATIEDALFCGLPDLVPVIGNGSGVGGTYLPDINKETLRHLNEADLILSKGQGNFETLHECGLNIYYLFLCKCGKFMQKFHAQMLQGMFINEKRI